MSALARIVTLAAAAGLAILTGCGTAPAGSATAPSPGATTPQAGATTPSPGGTSPGACQQPGSHLTAIRVGQYAGYDRVVFQFSGGLPVVAQTGAGTFKVTEPSGRVDTVSGVRPVTTPGPWVITTVVPGPLPV